MATIKISQLPNVGNIAGNTLLPVVSNTGTLITDKATVQQVGNFILAQAGNTFPQAAVATLAQSVTNAAQPNITSVGVLTNLTTSGNIIAANITGGNLVSANFIGGVLTTANQPYVTGLGNLSTLTMAGVANLGPAGNVKITGGNNGYFLQTDGAGNLTWSSGTGGGGNGTPGGSNTQIQFNDAGDFGGDAGLTFDKTTTTLIANNFIATSSSDLGAVGNITIEGGSSGQVLSTDGAGNLDWVTISSGANANYANYANLAEFVTVESVSNNFSYHIVLSTGPGDSSLHSDETDNLQYNPSDGTLTTVRLDADFVLADLGFSSNIPAANITGLDAYTGNISANVIAANIANVVNLNVTGNVLNDLLPNANITYDLGSSTQRWKDIWLANSTIYIGNSTISAGNANSVTFSGTIQTDGNITAPANSDVVITTTAGMASHDWTFGFDGNLTLPGNTFSVNYANGDQVSIGGGGNTGNVTFSNVTVQGDNNALNLSAGADFTANLAYLQVRAGDVASHIHFDTGNSQAYDLFLGNDDKYVQVSSTGNIIMSSYDGNTSYIMTLDNTGDLILAGGSSIVRSVANSSLDPINPNVSTMILIPDAGYTSQSLVLDPTAPGHIHLRAPGANIDEPSANIFLGGEDSSFEVGYYNGSAPNVFIHSGGNTWEFLNDGNLVFPRDAAGNTDPFLRITGGASPRILSEDVSLAGPANLEITALNTIFTGSSGTEIKIYPDDGEIGSTGNLELWANAGSNVAQYNWTFDTTGNLTTPSNLVIGPTGLGTGTGFTQSDAPLLLGSSEANGRASLIWYENPTGPGNVVQVGLNDSTPGSMTVLTGDFANTTYVWDFDNTGNLTLPTGGALNTTGNIVSNGYARFSGTFDESQASTAGLYLGYAGNTSRIMFGTGNTAQTFEIDNDGGNLRFYMPGSTKATLTSAGDLSVLGNITANNLSNLVQWTTAPVANTSAGTAGQAAYDSGGNLYVCVSANTWAKFTGTTSW